MSKRSKRIAAYPTNQVMTVSAAGVATGLAEAAAAKAVTDRGYNEHYRWAVVALPAIGALIYSQSASGTSRAGRDLSVGVVCGSLTVATMMLAGYIGVGPKITKPQMNIPESVDRTY